MEIFKELPFELQRMVLMMRPTHPLAKIIKQLNFKEVNELYERLIIKISWRVKHASCMYILLNYYRIGMSIEPNVYQGLTHWYFKHARPEYCIFLYDPFDHEYYSDLTWIL